MDPVQFLTEICQQRVDVLRFRNPVCGSMRIKVAVRTLFLTPGYVHVERQGREVYHRLQYWHADTCMQSCISIRKTVLFGVTKELTVRAAMAGAAGRLDQ